MQKSHSLIKVEGLTLTSGPNILVRELNLEIAAGEAMALVGKTGSGKSLTAAAIMGLLPPGVRNSSGNITYSSNLPGENNLEQLRGRFMAMIFQDPAQTLNPALRIGTQIKETLDQLGQPAEKEHVHQLLQRVELDAVEAIYRAYPHQLSGGQQQRVMIALALAGKPKVLIADEPLASLDLAIQNEIISLLQRLRKSQHLALLFISHDLSLALRLCEKVTVLDMGRQVFSGESQALADQASPEIGELLSPKPQFPPPVESTEKPLARVENLGVNFGKRGSYWGRGLGMAAVEDVSFSIGRKEILGILGASGSGKTTLARAICGLQDLESGTISWSGEGQSRVQMIFQQPGASLNPRHRIGQMLDEVAGANNQAVDGDFWLGQVELDKSVSNRFPHQLSGGQQQRVALARALAANPDLLICDEPVSALDPHIGQQILDLLVSLRIKNGLTLLLISHDISVLERICQRVLVMEKGRIVEEGHSPNLFQNLTSPAAKKIILAAEELKQIDR